MDWKRLDQVRVGIALLAAVLTGGGALYGVYSKTRQATAASYGTLAPAINGLKQAVTDLQAEVRDLRAREARASLPRPRAPVVAAPARPAEPAPPPSAPSPAPSAPAENQGVLDRLEKKIPVDIDRAVEVWKDVQKARKPRGSGG